MSAAHAPNSPPSESTDSQAIVYDPNDPFWQDTEEDDDDDDMDFLPADDGEGEEDDDEDGMTVGEFYDASETMRDLSTVELSFEYTEDDDEDEEGEGEEEENGDDAEEGNTAEAFGTGQPITITRDQMMQLLGQGGLRRFFSSSYTPQSLQRLLQRGVQDDDESDSDSSPEYDPSGNGQPTRRPKRPRGRAAFDKVPSERGRELMESGLFGSNPRRPDTITRKKRLAYAVMQRELGLGSDGRQKNAAHRLVKQDMIPESAADTIIHYSARCYSGQFSDDGNFFFSCAQDFKVRMYDTSNPYDWKYYKEVEYPYGSWTITDASLSRDNRFLAYSSIKNIVCLASTDPWNDSEPNLLDFAHSGRPIRRGYYSDFGIWSIRFSGDGREIVAGSGDNSVYVYDIERRQSILRIPGHADDVNAVCFGDANSPHILYSGSDDTTIKIWDRRSMGDGREAGVFLGHTEGLTYVDSKGDGRYVLSNAKDQTAKLWDLRKLISTDKADRIDVDRYTTRFEYRSSGYDDNDYRPHPHDVSLVTFRGHKVLKTLIRAHFSPPGSTDARYVYSGSYDGAVYVWNLDATLAGRIDVLESTKESRPRDGREIMDPYGLGGRYGNSWNTCVRDASWHPYVPVVAATSWNGWGTAQGTCTVHSWNDGLASDDAEPAVGRNVDEHLRPLPPPGTSTRARRRRVWLDEGDDE